VIEEIGNFVPIVVAAKIFDLWHLSVLLDGDLFSKPVFAKLGAYIGPSSDVSDPRVQSSFADPLSLNHIIAMLYAVRCVGAREGKVALDDVSEGEVFPLLGDWIGPHIVNEDLSSFTGWCLGFVSLVIRHVAIATRFGVFTLSALVLFRDF
jgi:hypothetical protein